MKPDILAAGGIGHGVAVGGTVGVLVMVSLVAASEVVLEVVAVCISWGVDEGAAVMIDGGGMSLAKRPAAATGAATVGKIGVGSAGKAQA